ncbi:MAG: MarR family transcriptional regulator [Deltaproteobacteria bacterium]|nr:MarR family transcriptional regulator [Deltaproteobacteria bacterium]
MRPGGTLGFMRALWELTHALQVSSKRMARVLGVTGPQRLVIRVVGQSPGITARDLATSLGLHPSTLTGVLDRLEKQAFLIRSVDPSDRRRARFDLTARGKRVDRERKGTVEAAVKRALARADAGTVAKTHRMLALLVAELERE